MAHMNVQTFLSAVKLAGLMSQEDYDRLLVKPKRNAADEAYRRWQRTAQRWGLDVGPVGRTKDMQGYQREYYLRKQVAELAAEYDSLSLDLRKALRVIAELRGARQ